MVLTYSDQQILAFEPWAKIAAWIRVCNNYKALVSFIMYAQLSARHASIVVIQRQRSVTRSSLVYVWLENGVPL